MLNAGAGLGSDDLLFLLLLLTEKDVMLDSGVSGRLSAESEGSSGWQLGEVRYSNQ